MSITRDFQVFAKPVGAACNLECCYCYYLRTEHLHGADAARSMPHDVLERYIAQHIEASSADVIPFAWHGGEPALAGLAFFREAVALQRKYLHAGRRAANGIQTNGLLIDEEWCRFLAEERFWVGLSLDGAAQHHDAYRLTKGHRPTHGQALRAFDLLRRHRVPCDVLCVVHDRNVGEPLRVYRFLKSIGARSLTFLPLVQPPAGEARGRGNLPAAPRSVPADDFGAFLCAIFDEWIERDTGRVSVQMFDEATRPARGLDHSLCIFRETCGDVPVVERDGEVYACDHYVDAEHRLGNIRDDKLADLIESRAQRSFGRAKRDALPRRCRECQVLPMCNGGCPKDRVAGSEADQPPINYLCPSFKRFFEHVQARGRRLWAAPPSLDGVMSAGEPARARSAVGRNEPCPCGSGRKYKKCCYGKA